MKISVTKQDIKKGEPGSCKNCAISQALKRYFKTNKTYTEIDDDTGNVLLTVNDKKYQVDDKTCMSTTDDDVQYFISDYDMLVDGNRWEEAYCIPEPIEFNIKELK